MADVPTDEQTDEEGTASLDHEAVLDAAAACYLRFGVAKTTAADIAKAAGTSRATLYRRFGTHEEILLEVLVRESEQMLADAAAQTQATDHPVDQVIEGMVHAVREVQRRPVHAAVFGDESAGWVAGRALRLQAMRRLGEQGVRPAIWPITCPRLRPATSFRVPTVSVRRRATLPSYPSIAAISFRDSSI